MVGQRSSPGRRRRADPLTETQSFLKAKQHTLQQDWRFGILGFLANATTQLPGHFELGEPASQPAVATDGTRLKQRILERFSRIDEQIPTFLVQNHSNRWASQVFLAAFQKELVFDRGQVGKGLSAFGVCRRGVSNACGGQPGDSTLKRNSSGRCRPSTTLWVSTDLEPAVDSRLRTPRREGVGQAAFGHRG